MNINFYTYSELSEEQLRNLCQRSEIDTNNISDSVKKIIEEIHTDGDKAISDHLKKFDGVNLNTNSIKVTEEEFLIAEERLDNKIKLAIDHAIKNIKKFHSALLPEEIIFKQIEDGVMAGEKYSPIDSVGLYVPRGKGSFPSVLCMLAVPAVIAKVPFICICTPPNKEGLVDDASLYAAKKIGVENIYKVGGASAVAALTYGTDTVKKVLKVVGPSNQYGVAAKRILADSIDVGLPAGPSESIILTDGSVSFDKVLLDLLIEAEHGSDSSAFLVTHDKNLAKEVAEKLPKIISELPEPRKSFCTNVFSKDGYGGILLTDSLSQSFEFVNEYAPEHLELLTKEPFQHLDKIRNAGEILLGEHTPITLGNYCIGVNAILPTSAKSKTHSCTSTDTFLKKTSLAYCSKEGFESLRETALNLAEFEDFPSHANAIKNRSN